MQTTTQLLRRGRLTIPKPVRDALNLEEGDLVEIDVQPVETADER